MQKKKQMPILHNDDEVEDFVANCDLTEYDFSGFKPIHYVLVEESNSLKESGMPTAGGGL